MNFCVCTYISINIPTHNGCVMKSNKYSYSIPKWIMFNPNGHHSGPTKYLRKTCQNELDCWLLNWIIYHSISHGDILSKYWQSSTPLKFINIEINVSSKRWARCFWMYNEYQTVRCPCQMMSAYSRYKRLIDLNILRERCQNDDRCSYENLLGKDEGEMIRHASRCIVEQIFTLRCEIY